MDKDDKDLLPPGVDPNKKAIGIRKVTAINEASTRSVMTVRGHIVITDEKGSDTGPTPLELTLSSLIGCEGVIINRCAEAMSFTYSPNEKIKQFYLDHDVFILPATKEPAAISPLEAMGFGLPAICSNTNGTRFYIENNTTGIIFEDNSYKSLKRAINSLLDESEVHRMKENVRVVAKKNMSKSNFYNSFIDIL